MPKRHRDGYYIFRDHPDFRPNLSPREMFRLGSFGGTYWRPIYSSVTKKNYVNPHLEFPKSWWRGIPDEMLVSPKCNKKLNKYGVNSGTSLKYWEQQGWMRKQDPYGWVQWYCRFFQGRRSADDERQIKRWLNVMTRFGKRLAGMIKKKRTKYNDFTVSPVIRQLLQHWGYKLTAKDYRRLSA